jgi:hypothetical protein
VPKRISQTARHASRALGLTPRTGSHPGRYWPVLLLTVALAESAHAPFVNGARGASTPAPPSAPPASPLKSPGSLTKGRDDMHGPHKPDLELNNDKKKKTDDPQLADVQWLVDPITFHGVHDEVVPAGGGGYIINGGGSGELDPPDDTIWIPIVHGGDGGAGGDAGDGGSDGGTAQNGTVDPTVHSGTDAVPIPEPGSVSILLSGVVLLGRRGNRRRL